MQQNLQKVTARFNDGASNIATCYNKEKVVVPIGSRAIHILLTVLSFGIAISPLVCSAQPEALPPIIKIALIKELTGSAGFAGVSMKKGIDLAVEQVNSSGYLGSGVKLQIDSQDTASVTQTAVSMVAQAVAKPEYVAILGPSNSDAGGATAPITQRAKVPMVFSQSLGDGVLVGDYIFRISGPLDGYYENLAISYLKSKGVKTVSVMYNSTSLRQAQAATEMLPALSQKSGIKILSNTGVPITNTDFTAIATKVATEKPDAVIYFMAGAQHVTAVQQVRRAGYAGILMGGSGIETSLGSVGAAGEGIVWVAPFSYLWQNQSAAAFTKAYEAKYAGEHPLAYAAEAYDSVWWIARALKVTGSGTREALQRGLVQLSKTGFDGAQGKIAFSAHDARTQGILMQWAAGKQSVLKRGDQ